MHGSDNSTFAFGMWTVVAFNVVAFVFFAISFVRPLSLERRCEHGYL